MNKEDNPQPPTKKLCKLWVRLVLAVGHSCAVSGQFNQVSATGIGYGYKVLNKLRCLQKRKKKSESSGGNLTGFSPDE